jgi:hypothetical protein
LGDNLWSFKDTNRRNSKLPISFTSGADELVILLHCDYWDEIVVHQDNDHKCRDNYHDPRRKITNNP